MKYRGYIFDLDGVLIDSSKIHYQGWRTVLNRFGTDVSFEVFKRDYFGKRGVETLEKVFGKEKFSGDEVRKLSDEVDSNFVNIVAQVGVPIKGALEFLRGLKKSGAKTALGTSAPRQNVDAFLDAFDLRGVFDVEVCGDDVYRGKPDPEVFLKAASGLNEQPGHCVVFEDSVPGVAAAKAAGAVCVALLTTTSREALKAADFFIRDFSDETLKKIIRTDESFGPKVKERA